MLPQRFLRGKNQPILNPKLSPTQELLTCLANYNPSCHSIPPTWVLLLLLWACSTEIKYSIISLTLPQRSNVCQTLNFDQDIESAVEPPSGGHDEINVVSPNCMTNEMYSILQPSLSPSEDPVGLQPPPNASNSVLNESDLLLSQFLNSPTNQTALIPMIHLQLYAYLFSLNFLDMVSVHFLCFAGFTSSRCSICTGRHRFDDQHAAENLPPFDMMINFQQPSSAFEPQTPRTSTKYLVTPHQYRPWLRHHRHYITPQWVRQPKLLAAISPPTIETKKKKNVVKRDANRSKGEASFEGAVELNLPSEATEADARAPPVQSRLPCAAKRLSLAPNSPLNLNARDESLNSLVGFESDDPSLNVRHGRRSSRHSQSTANPIPPASTVLVMIPQLKQKNIWCLNCGKSLLFGHQANHHQALESLHQHDMTADRKGSGNACPSVPTNNQRALKAQVACQIY
ncbi:hypothetical protein VP01_4950g1 [Puccinia sorghi]|uniref:Uncharacterized protein n=1 Tax=Puccinia sorghi TaxID=27349 RepID=A0A0L6ULY7_9BASI|nr:hypothetical protein VP01_4950g1 [Puccinia sorghi]